MDIKKGSFTLSGGNDYIKLLLSASKEESNQYEDSDGGDDFVKQQIKYGVPMANRYSDDSLEAYEKKTVLTKAIVNIDDSSEVALSYTANRSDNILYPNTPMDADFDYSDIYTVEFTKRGLGDYSKELKAEYYYSKVGHPMSVRLRNSSMMMMKDLTNHMKSSIWGGAKIKNKLDLADGELTVGLDTSKRNWKGEKFNSDLSVNAISLPSTDTKKIKQSFQNMKKNIWEVRCRS